MKNSNPILIIEDDNDDCELIQAALEAIGVKNQQLCFTNGEEALNYLKSTSQETFLILSDVNMPRKNGFELKKEINQDDELRQRSIPFVFLSTSISKREVSKAYDLMAQGFFQKPERFDTIKDMLQTVTTYWDTCRHPNSN